MLTSIQETLRNEIRDFISSIKTNGMIANCHHLIVALEVFDQKIIHLKNKNFNLNSFSENDFDWIEELQILISTKNEKITEQIISSATTIIDAATIIKNYILSKSSLLKRRDGDIYSIQESCISNLIDAKIFTQAKSIATIKDQTDKNKNLISELNEIKISLIDKEKDQEILINNRLNDFNSALNTELRNMKNISSENIERRFSEKLDELAEIKRIHSETLRLSSEIAGNIISNDFNKSSNREKKLADFMRIIGLLILALTLILIFFNIDDLNSKIINADKSKFEYVSIAKTSLLSFLLISLGLIFLKESAKHRAQQYVYESKALKISSISPLISDIPKENQYLVKQEIAKSLFLEDNNINVSDDSSSAFLGLTNIVNKLIDKKNT